MRVAAVANAEPPPTMCLSFAVRLEYRKSMRDFILTALTGAMLAAGPAGAQAPAPPTTTLTLQAAYAATNRAVQDDLVWRLYAIRNNEPVLVSQSNEARPTLPVTAGEYMVHVAHGLASATKRVVIAGQPVADRLALNAGGLVLRGKLAEAPIPAERQALAVYISAPNDSENRLVTRTLKPGQLIRLPEGPYHIVSTYAGSNSVVRADIVVQSGKVTEATMSHRAASVTLKLVRMAGGVAQANTSWTVQTPGGDIIHEAIGAFPTMQLAEGEYDVVARNDGREYKDKVKVVSGVNRDHEVVMR